MGALSDGTRMLHREHLWSDTSTPCRRRRSVRRWNGEHEERARARAELVHAGSARSSRRSSTRCRGPPSSRSRSSRRRISEGRRRVRASDRPSQRATDARRIRGAACKRPRRARPSPAYRPTPSPSSSQSPTPAMVPPVRPSALTTIAQAPGARAARVHTLNDGLTVSRCAAPACRSSRCRLGFPPTRNRARRRGHATRLIPRFAGTCPSAPERGVLRHIHEPRQCSGVADQLSRNADKALDLLSMRPTPSSSPGRTRASSAGPTGGAHRGDGRRSWRYAHSGPRCSAITLITSVRRRTWSARSPVRTRESWLARVAGSPTGYW